MAPWPTLCSRGSTRKATRVISNRAAASALSQQRLGVRASSSESGPPRSSTTGSRCSNETMSKKCPNCGSPDVQRSHFLGHEEHERYPLRSPYRCNACGGRFFVISRKVRRAMIGLLAVVALMIAFATIALLIPPEPPKPPKPPTPSPLTPLTMRGAAALKGTSSSGTFPSAVGRKSG